jgi:transposase
MPSQPALLDLPEAQTPKPPEPPVLADLRVARPDRHQIELVTRSLDETLPCDHPARAIWTFIEGLDLSDFYARIRSVVDQPGRPASDPRVLLALWVYATVDAVGSARRLARLCREHDAYRWLRGGVPVNYHLLSDFRVAHPDTLDALLTQIVSVLLHQHVVTLERVAQDGVRVRASAGTRSFRRRATLERCHEDAKRQVQRVAKERDHPDPGVSKRQQAAKERAARERQERIEAALAEMPKVEAIKERQKKHAGKARQKKITEARVSTTDPESRVMEMADHGYRPADNVQIATDIESGVIVGVTVTNRGADQGEALPMCEQVQERTGQSPGMYLMDGGFVDLEDIAQLERQGITVLAPPKKVPEGAPPPGGPHESSGVTTWRCRMETDAAKILYRQRASSAEWVNAQARERHGLRQFRVRGLAKVTSVMLLMAVTHNLLRWIALGTPA